MPEQTTRDAKLVSLLNEAFGKERQLQTTLESHIELTTRDDYRKRLKAHLKETKSHATAVARRIKQLGGNAETVTVPGPEGATKAAETIQGVMDRARAATQGPLQRAKRSGEQATMLRNARAEYRDEAEEIATYTAIDAVATAVGDKETAKLARGIRTEEERMAKFIGDLIPQLATDVAHDEIPVSEIEGDAARRTSTRSGRTRKASPKASARGSAAAGSSMAKKKPAGSRAKRK